MPEESSRFNLGICCVCGLSVGLGPVVAIHSAVYCERHDPVMAGSSQIRLSYTASALYNRDDRAEFMSDTADQYRVHVMTPAEREAPIEAPKREKNFGDWGWGNPGWEPKKKPRQRGARLPRRGAAG